MRGFATEIFFWLVAPGALLAVLDASSGNVGDGLKTNGAGADERRQKHGEGKKLHFFCFFLLTC